MYLFGCRPTHGPPLRHFDAATALPFCHYDAVAALLLLFFPILPSSFLLPPLFLHRPFHFTLFFFLVKILVGIGILYVCTPVHTGTYYSSRLSKRVWYPKRQTLVVMLTLRHMHQMPIFKKTRISVL